MKEYIDQIFYEGLGTSLYVPVERLINRIDNNKIKKLLTIIFKSVYFIIAVGIAVGLFYIKI